LQGKVAALVTCGALLLQYQFHLTFLRLLCKSCDNCFSSLKLLNRTSLNLLSRGGTYVIASLLRTSRLH